MESHKNENTQNTDVLSVQPLQENVDVLTVQPLQENADVLTVQPLQEIDFSAVEEALVPLGEEQETLPAIFDAMPDKPY